MKVNVFSRIPMENKHAYEILAEVVPHMKERPGMYFHPVNFNNLRIYMEGFITGLAWGPGEEGNREISRWLGKKVQRGSNVIWTAHVLALANDDEQKAWDLLFHYLEEFLKEKGYPPSKG